MLSFTMTIEALHRLPITNWQGIVSVVPKATVRKPAIRNQRLAIFAGNHIPREALYMSTLVKLAIVDDMAKLAASSNHSSAESTHVAEHIQLRPGELSFNPCVLVFGGIRGWQTLVGMSWLTNVSLLDNVGVLSDVRQQPIPNHPMHRLDGTVRERTV